MLRNIPAEVTQDLKDRLALGSYKDVLTTLVGLRGAVEESTTHEIMLRFFALVRYDMTVEELRARRAAGNFKAHKQLQRIYSDLDDWDFGIPLGEFRFKTKEQHLGLIALVLDYEREKLTPEEMEDCFNLYCPCEKSHDADALRHLRRKFEQLIKNLPSAQQDRSCQ